MGDPRPTESAGEPDRFAHENGEQQQSVSQLVSSSYRLRYQELFDFALDAQVVTDLRGVILEANYAAAALFRYPKPFLLGKPLGLLLAEGYRDRFYQCLPSLVRFGGPAELESRLGHNGACRVVALRALNADSPMTGRRTLRWQVQDITASKRAELARQELLRRMVSSQEEERRRVSREIHDQLGQELTALILGLKSLESDIPEASPARGRLRALQEAAHSLGRQSHDIAFELRPAALDDLGLRAAVQGLVGRWSERTGIAAGFHFACAGIGRFSPDVESTMYRIIQEALTNVAKHAGASGVSVIIEHINSHLMVIVEDDGQGFEHVTDGVSTKLGLLGMNERVAMVGGSLQIESSSGVGTTVRARIPCEGISEAGH
jgi:PAS domain S-box-containing protein